MVRGTAAALGTDLENRARSETGVALFGDRIHKHIGGIHVFGHGLFAVCVLARLDRGGRVLSVLEVGGGDDYGIDVLRVFVKIFVARIRFDAMADDLFDTGLRVLVETLLPEVGDGDHVEIHFLRVRLEAGKQRTAETVGITDARDADSVVCADDIQRRRLLGLEDSGHGGG